MQILILRKNGLLRFLGFFLVISFGLIMNAFAVKRIYTGFLSNQAISGYDAVSYFSEGKPLMGTEELKAEYQGANWYFSSQKNLNRFKNNPKKFAPQYGGYCAWAVSQGYTAKGDPLYWTIHNEKLYLNYNLSINQKWLNNREAFITQADMNWPGVIE